MTTGEYCRAVESYLCKVNGGHLVRIVGPAFDRVCDWEARGIPVTLRVLDSPYREITRPILEYVKQIRADSNDLVIVYIPEYVVGHWWEGILHNQSALRLKTRLRFVPKVIVAAVPYQMASTELLSADSAPGQ